MITTTDMRMMDNWCQMCEYKDGEDDDRPSRCTLCRGDFAKKDGTIIPIHFVHSIDKWNTPDPSQTAKSDYGKPQLALVPIEDIWKAIAAIREYGNEKYHDPDNWKNVSIERYHNALLRHIAACANDINAKDAESGSPHLWHAACNMAFIMALQKMEKEKK